VLDPKVRAMASFEERNLVVEDATFWAPGSFDVVFCRNVTMYFAPETMRAVVARIRRALVPGGFLFMGHAESLRGISQGFHLCHTHETFYYQRREPTDVATDDLGLPAWASTSTPANVADLGESSWVDVIHGASERIATITAHPQASPPAATTARPTWDLRPAVELLRRERFSEAMDLLHAMPASAHVDPETLLLLAVLLTNAGRLDEAERVCERLLAVDELNAGAHYLMALCCEHAGDAAGASDHDQSATYLDPDFVMPHLHLGLLARRAGDVVRAKSELGRALALLPREDGSRILLFGGGFTREALVDLCRSEMRRCGGEP
jgi:chemotaxis protein methyltransferase CheR